MANNGNLNKFKHRNKRRKNPNATFDANTDEYAFVVELCGDKHVSAQILDGHHVIVKALIPGRFFKKVWFRKNDLLVITKLDAKRWEIKGRVDENNAGHVKMLMQQQIVGKVGQEEIVFADPTSNSSSGTSPIRFNESDDELETTEPILQSGDEQIVSSNQDSDELDISAI